MRGLGRGASAEDRSFLTAYRSLRPGETVIKILVKPAEIDWDCDEEADVLYLSAGEHKPAVGVDVGSGGYNLIDLRARLLRKLDHNDQVDGN